MSSSNVAIPGIALVGVGALLLSSGWTKRSLADTWNSKPVGGSSPDGAGGSVSLAPGAVSGHPSYPALLLEMERMVSLQQPYLWGGGHGGYNDSGPWDCSGAISQALHVSGFLSGSPRISTGFMGWGDAGRGKYFTVYSNPTHVFLIVEAGPHKGEAWGTTRSAPGGGVGWHHHPTFGFVARHYPGA